MRIMLDTHIFLWFVKNDRKLQEKTCLLIQNADEVFVSSASIWEAAIKSKLGKLSVDMDSLVEAIASSGFEELPITAQHAAMVNQLPDIHRDPFDRILIAQAISEPLVFLTADEILKDYSSLVKII